MGVPPRNVLLEGGPAASHLAIGQYVVSQVRGPVFQRGPNHDAHAVDDSNGGLFGLFPIEGVVPDFGVVGASLRG